MAVKYGLLNANGNLRAIRFDDGMEKTISQIIIVASSKKSLVNKLNRDGYSGCLNDGLIRGLNDGQRCAKYAIGV